MYCLQLPLSSATGIQNLLYIVAVMVQVGMYCYWGNEITLESQGISLACYETSFAGTDLSFQRDLKFIMQCSHRPLILTAGKLTNLSLDTFMAVSI